MTSEETAKLRLVVNAASIELDQAFTKYKKAVGAWLDSLRKDQADKRGLNIETVDVLTNALKTIDLENRL